MGNDDEETRVCLLDEALEPPQRCGVGPLGVLDHDRPWVDAVEVQLVEDAAHLDACRRRPDRPRHGPIGR
jgi:hypothetical protein